MSRIKEYTGLNNIDCELDIDDVYNIITYIKIVNKKDNRGIDISKRISSYTNYNNLKRFINIIFIIFTIFEYDTHVNIF